MSVSFTGTAVDQHVTMNRVVGYERLEEAAEAAKRFMEKMDLREADEAFRFVLDGLTPSTPQRDQLRVTSLTGLAEIHVKRCRSLDGDVEEWLRGMFCAFALYKEAMEISETKTGVGQANGSGTLHTRRDPLDIRHFEEMRSRCGVQMKVIEENLVVVLGQEIVRRCLRTKPGLYLKNKTVFDDGWLHELTRYCTTGRRTTTAQEDPHSAGEDQERRAFCSVVEEEKTTASSTYVPMFKRRIDFDRLQEGIKRIVSEVSSDVRSQYVHFTRHVPESLMQRRLFSELTLRLSPGNRENVDLLNVLEESVQYEDCSEMACNVEVESRRSHVEEVRRGVMRRDAASDLNSVVELDETEEEEERYRRKEEEEDDEKEGRGYDTIELRVNPSAMHSERGIIGAASGCVEDGRVTVAGTNNRSVTSASRHNESLRRPSGLSLGESQSRRYYYGNSMRSDGGHSGLSGAFCMSGILTLWRTPRPNTNPAALAGASLFRAKELHNFEEVSPLTERDKVLRWLQSVEPEPRERQTDGECVRIVSTGHPGSDRVGQAIGHAAKNVADAFRKENHQSDAYEIYKYAMALFQKHPLRHGQMQMMADLLLRVGLVKCSMGQLATGSQLMEESVAMLERSVTGSERFRIAEVWFQVGNVFLADKLRQESLQARIMQLIRDEIETFEREEEEASAVDQSGSENSDQNDSYCVCIYEAMTCYKKALAVLDALTLEERNHQVPELLINVLSNMADCYVMTGNLDLAELGYEEALHLFPDAHGSPLLTRNSHVLSMLGTVSFLLRNFVRAATMYETASILLQHLQSLDDPSLEMAWTSTMLGLSYFSLRHYDKSIVWCIRAFTLYTRFFRGKILDVDPLSRWFIVQTLYALGFAYSTLEINDKALYHLNLAKNMTTNSARDPQDVHQLVKVLRAIADAYSNLEEPTKALRYYEDALEQSKSLGDENTTTALRNQLLNRMSSVNVDSRNYTEAGDNLEQALDYQKDVESSIKEDMIAILLKLGVTSTIACDLDKAIGCYTDCIQAYRESKRKTEAEDVAAVMASLGTLCHVKGCMQDDDDDEEAFMDKAECYFEEAFQLTGSASPVCVQYANFLYQQGRNADALLVMLPYVFGERPAEDEIIYNGIEQAVLPDHLHYDADDEDALVVEARVFAKFLAILCYCQLGMVAEADDALVLLYSLTAQSVKAFNVVILGYALMEMRLFGEAAEVFMDAARLQPDGCKQTYTNACICHLLSAYVTLARAVHHLLEYIHRTSEKHSHEAATFETKKRNLIVISPVKQRSTESVPSPEDGGTMNQTRSIGHLRSPDEWQRSDAKAFHMNSSSLRHIDNSLRSPVESDTRDKSLEDRARRCGTSDDPSIGSDDFRASSGGQAAGSEDEADREDDWEEWTTEEVIVETPREILELIANQINRNRSNLNGQLFRHQWTESTTDRRPSVTESALTQHLHRTDSTVTQSDSCNRFIPPVDSKTSPEALDNAAFAANEVNGPRPDVREPEVNGNLNLRNEEESSEEWVITEEVIETPAEILALLKRNSYCP